MLDYEIQRNCNLTQVGGLLNSNSYGIATPIGKNFMMSFNQIYKKMIKQLYIGGEKKKISLGHIDHVDSKALEQKCLNILLRVTGCESIIYFLGSPWRDKISLAILELQEKGIIQMLYSKWWRNTGDICNRDDKSKDSKANALGVENIGKSYN